MLTVLLSCNNATYLMTATPNGWSNICAPFMVVFVKDELCKLKKVKSRPTEKNPAGLSALTNAISVCKWWSERLLDEKGSRGGRLRSNVWLKKKMILPLYLLQCHKTLCQMFIVIDSIRQFWQPWPSMTSPAHTPLDNRDHILSIRGKSDSAAIH